MLHPANSHSYCEHDLAHGKNMAGALQVGEFKSDGWNRGQNCNVEMGGALGGSRSYRARFQLNAQLDFGQFEELRREGKLTWRNKPYVVYPTRRGKRRSSGVCLPI